MSFTYFDTVFPSEASDGRDLGYAAIALYPEGIHAERAVRYFSWPSQKEDLVAFCLHNTELDILASPALYKKRGSIGAENIAHQWCAFADADALDLRSLKAEPSLIVEVAPGRHQVYWTTSVDNPAKLTEISRTISHTHAPDGCNRDGWDAGQMLRIPGTSNTARGSFEVRIKGEPGQMYSGLSRLNTLYPADGAKVDASAMPSESAWKNSAKVADEASQLFRQSPTIHSLYLYKTDAERSTDILARLLRELSRNGASRLVGMHIAWNARSNSHTQAAGPAALWAALCKVYDDPANYPVTTSIEASERDRLDTSEENPELKVRDAISKVSVLLDEERSQVPHDTFIDRYAEWAATRTDAPDIYHRAGAIALLTCIFGEFGCCPTTHDTNLTLWVLLLGPTTRARKTTSMNLWVDLLCDLQNDKHDYLFGSDTTPEGLNLRLSKRDGKTSLFYRDEVHGFFHEAASKRYLAGLTELMTELYGGRVRGRVRASDNFDESTETPSKTVRTNFVMFLCGTLDQVTQALTVEAYQSGHLPRFLAVEANPPELTEEDMYTDQYDGVDESEDPQRLALMHELEVARDFWAEGAQPGKLRRILVEDDAWRRLQKAMFEIYRLAKSDATAEALAPTAQRLGVSVMKAAILLAMAERQPRAQMRHVLKALELSEEWLASTAVIAGRVMHSRWYASQEEVLTMVRSRMDGVTQQEIYSRFRAKMTTKEIESIIGLLLKAELIRRAPDRGRVRYVRTPNT